MRLLLHPAMLVSGIVWITMLGWMAAQILRAPEGVQDDQGFHPVGRSKVRKALLGQHDRPSLPSHS